jgi:hypothetical protein
VEESDTPEELLLALAHGVDFARRYYSLVASTRASEPGVDLSDSEIESALKATGRTFRRNRKESFYALREVNAPGELGLNLAIDGSVEFILVARGSSGHFGPTFHGLALELAERHAPELVPTPQYPRPAYGSAAELVKVLVEGMGLYAELAAAIRSKGLLG